MPRISLLDDGGAGAVADQDAVGRDARHQRAAHLDVAAGVDVDADAAPGHDHVPQPDVRGVEDVDVGGDAAAHAQVLQRGAAGVEDEDPVAAAEAVDDGGVGSGAAQGEAGRRRLVEDGRLHVEAAGQADDAARRRGGDGRLQALAW